MVNLSCMLSLYPVFSGWERYGAIPVLGWFLRGPPSNPKQKHHFVPPFTGFRGDRRQGCGCCCGSCPVPAVDAPDAQRQSGTGGGRGGGEERGEEGRNAAKMQTVK